MSKSLLAATLGSLLTIWVVPASALDFNFRHVAIPCTSKPCSVNALVGSGEIRRGDAQRLREFLGVGDNAMTYLGPPSEGAARLVLLDSRGGDVEEAIRLAGVLREIQASVGSMPPMVCESACFFLYVGAAKRFGWFGRALAVHRPYFAAEVTRTLSLAQAEAAHNAAFERARHWLQDQLVPQALIDKMFSLPSTDAYWLTKGDVDQLGENTAWYEEWLLAQCPTYVNFARIVEIAREQGDEAAKRIGSPGWQCEALAIRDEVTAVLLRYQLDSTARHSPASKSR